MRPSARPPEDAPAKRASWRRGLAVTQGAFYLATGLWPFASMKSFLAVTGPKRDLWLVRTVGALVCVVGAVLVESARRDGPSREVALLGAGSAAALAGIELYYGGRRRISAVYLADSAVELALGAAWGLAAVPLPSSRRDSTVNPRSIPATKELPP